MNYKGFSTCIFTKVNLLKEYNNKLKYTCISDPTEILKFNLQHFRHFQSPLTKNVSIIGAV